MITSRDNKIFKTAKALRERHFREKQGLFLAEGARAVHDAVQKGVKLGALLVKEGFAPDFEPNCPTYTFAPRLFDEICQTITPQGVAAICAVCDASLYDIAQGENACVILCEDVRDPGNIGTIIRTAHACGADGVVLTKGCCDLYNPKIVRASMSSIFSVPIVREQAAADALAFFKKSGFKIVGGALSEEAVSLYGADLKGKVLLVVGNEGDGISESTLNRCDERVIIPMKKDAESLNAAVAAGILIYEHGRQNLKNI